MKQRIAVSQVLQLSDPAIKKLVKIRGITGDSGVDCPEKMFEALRLNIGEMIEFLDENKVGYVIYDDASIGATDSGGIEACGWGDSDELCDNLWEAVKQILEKE